jgi:hypothetical protein
MAYTIPLEIYQKVEEQVGKELAMQIAKTIENGIAVMEEQARALAVQKKMELKDELSRELVTKGEFNEFKAEMRGEFKAVREEMKTLEARLHGEIATMNVKLNFLIGLMILALTAMNPVVGELLKRWLKL